MGGRMGVALTAAELYKVIEEAEGDPVVSQTHQHTSYLLNKKHSAFSRRAARYEM